MAYALSRALSARALRFNLVFRLAAAHALWRQRRALANLDAHARRDLGLSEGDIHAELRRPLWDVPRNWRF